MFLSCSRRVLRTQRFPPEANAACRHGSFASTKRHVYIQGRHAVTTTATGSDSSRASSVSILSLPAAFLRAYDVSNFDPGTFQRTDVPFDGQTGKPIGTNSAPSCQILNCKEMPNGFEITWQDGKLSHFSKDWVKEQLLLWRKSDTDRIHWTGLTDSQVRQSSDLCLCFSDILTDKGMKHALKALYRYGILLITETPIRDDGAGIAALGAALGGGAVKNQLSIYKAYKDGNRDLVLPHGTDGPLRTLYGTVWATSSAAQAQGSSRADSAYGTEGLPLHTDMTYHRDPPGLQIFTMIQPASQGGESIFGDGFAAAERLRQRHPQAFATLSSTTRRYRSRDADTGWCLEATGPVILTDAADRVMAIRHNDLDRLPDLPPPEIDSAEMSDFYARLLEAHFAWDSILADDDIRLVIPLNPGETMVVANQVGDNGSSLCELQVLDDFLFLGFVLHVQRCFHGRFGFSVTADEDPRAVMGCYVSQDELNSRFRMEGYLAP